MYVGVDYYPEHWPRDRWDYDADLMKDAGFNVVRLAEFAWTNIEPEEGRYTFDWLDDALGVLNARGIKVILGTPTAVTPAWLAAKYPETAAEDNTGRRLAWGVRKGYCPTSGSYRLLSERVTRAMAERYASHPGVIGWQTDNEFEGPVCFCHHCRVDFREWLQRKYGTLDALNAAWGTHFWGHTYRQWSEIDPPQNIDHYNPGMCLDWQRHHTFRTVRYQREQVTVLRELCPGQFITHNLMAFGNVEVDGYALAEDLDFASYDNYPIWSDMTIPYEAAAAGDLTRGLKGKNYWIMETTAGPCGWSSFGRDPFPGEIRKVAFQQLAHGADGHLWFRWRTCTAGREQYWHGLLGHDGKPLRRYQEAARTAKEYHALADTLAGTTVRARVAMVFDWDSRWATRIQPGFEGNEFYHPLMLRYYRALFRAGVNVDIVPPTADLSKYKAVFASDLYVLPDNVAQRLVAYVDGGGVLLTGCRTGVKTETNLCHDRTLPGLLSEILGITIEEYSGHKLEIPVEGAGSVSGKFTSTKYCDWITAKGAETLAGYDHWHYAGFPAATRNRSGSGTAYYVGTIVKEEEFYDSVVAAVLKDAGVVADVVPPAGVEVSVREGDGKKVVFLMNHTEAPTDVAVPSGWKDLLTGNIVGGSVSLERFGVAVLSAAG